MTTDPMAGFLFLFPGEMSNLEPRGVEYFIIVSRNEPDLYEYLRDRFSRDRKVEVILDRRVEERRQRNEAREPERRRANRRQAPTFDFRTVGSVLIRKRPVPPSASTAT